MDGKGRCGWVGGWDGRVNEWMSGWVGRWMDEYVGDGWMNMN